MKTHLKIILSTTSLTIITLIGLFLGPEMRGHASSPASMTLGRTVVPEGNDFATTVLGQPWDMTNGPYPDYYTALKNISRNDFKVNGDGSWDLKSETTDPHIWLHWSGLTSTQIVLNMGDSKPIDASQYTLLSYYMCLDQAPSSASGTDEDWAGTVYWMYDRNAYIDPATGRSNFAFFKQQGLFNNNGDCALMTVDLSQPSAWATGSWNNNPNQVKAFRIDPINKSGKSFEIGWVRLTTVDSTNTVPLSWNDAPVGEIKFYLSRASCGVDGILVGKHANPNGSGTFEWGAQLQAGYSAAHPLPIPESFEPGEYTVYLKDLNGEVSCAAEKLTVHAAPTLKFLSPSRFSGSDYASTVVNNPWGLNNSQDIATMNQLSGVTYNEGIFSATTTGGDPIITMNVTSPIDTSKYRYATFRMKIDGTGNAGSGWVQRFLWWYNGQGVDSVTTQDLVLYEGWHTYSIDLKTAESENCSSNCWSGFPTGFRFDPVETPGGTKFHLDFLTLTTIDTVNRGDILKVYYTLPNAPGAAVTMYLDTDTNSNNGRIAAPAMTPNTSPGGNPAFDFEIFLPTLFRPGISTASEFNFFADALSFLIDTTDIPINTYYISADVYDGVMTTTWYSETPVIIK